MKYFSAEEILFSVFCSVIYGVIFALLTLSVVLILDIVIAFPRRIKKGFSYSGRLAAVEPFIQDKPIPVFFTVSGIILFFIGYVLLSYYSVDASFRLYVLLISGGTYLICTHIFKRFLRPVAVSILNRLLIIFIVTARVMTFPLLKLFVYIKGKAGKNRNN